MRDTVKLTPLGNSLGFTIVPAIHEALKLEWGDSVEVRLIEIIEGEKRTPISGYMTRKVIKIGGASKGVSIKKIFVEQYNLKVGDVLSVDIKKE